MTDATGEHERGREEDQDAERGLSLFRQLIGDATAGPLNASLQEVREMRSALEHEWGNFAAADAERANRLAREDTIQELKRDIAHVEEELNDFKRLVEETHVKQAESAAEQKASIEALQRNVAGLPTRPESQQTATDAVESVVQRLDGLPAVAKRSQLLIYLVMALGVIEIAVLVLMIVFRARA